MDTIILLIYIMIEIIVYYEIVHLYLILGICFNILQNKLVFLDIIVN